MSNWRGKVFYLVLTTLLLCAAYGYAKYRGLEARYHEHLENQVKIEGKTNEIAVKTEAVEKKRREVEGLENDPLEIEAKVRNISRAVRDGEIVYTLVGFPDNVADAEALVASMGDQGQTWEPN